MTVNSRVRFNSLAALTRHIERMADAAAAGDAKAIASTGHWSVAQNLYHLAGAFEASVEPPPAGAQRPPSRLRTWPLRLFAPRGRFPRNLSIPSEVRDRLSPPHDARFDVHLQRLLRAIESFGRATGRPPLHPVLGVLMREVWARFHLRHSELHLRHCAFRGD